MGDPSRWVVVGLDNGGTTNNATVLDCEDCFLVDRMVETPSYVREGPKKAIEALARSFDQVLELTGTPRDMVRAVGLDTPGPVSADGVISSRGATNFANAQWRGFDVRGALEHALGVRVLYNNDANAAALYAHHVYFGPGEADRRSSVASVSWWRGGSGNSSPYSASSSSMVTSSPARTLVSSSSILCHSSLGRSWTMSWRCLCVCFATASSSRGPED